MIFRGIEYSPAGERIIRSLAQEWHSTDDPAERSALAGEAEVIHAFHANFPGLTIHDSGREPKAEDAPGTAVLAAAAAPDCERTVSSPAVSAVEAASRPDTYLEGA